MINRNVEKALDLLGVQVKRKHPVRTGGDQEIGDELGGDRYSRLIFPVLARITKIGDDRRDSIGACSSGRIDQDEELHQILVRRRAGRLDDVNVAPPDIFVDFHSRFAIRKRTDDGVAQRSAHRLADSQSQIAVS